MQRRSWVAVAFLVVVVLVLSAPAQALASSLTPVVDAGDWLILQQAASGGFPWTPGGTVATNITGATARGLLQAYQRTGDSSYLNAATAAGNYLVPTYPRTYTDGDPRFATYDILFLEELSQVTGDATYANFVQTYFWDKLTAGVYGESNDQDAADFAQATIDSRTSQGYAALASWDLAGIPVAAELAGENTIRDAVMAKIKVSLEGLGASDTTFAVVGLAGAVWASAVSGYDLDPAAGIYAAAGSTGDLAALLASKQVVGSTPSAGGWPSSEVSTTQWVNDGSVWKVGFGDQFETTLTKQFTNVTADGISFKMRMNIEQDWDYGQLLISSDGTTFTPVSIPPFTTTTDPNLQNPGNGFTGMVSGDAQVTASTSIPEFVSGSTYWVQFRFIADAAASGNGGSSLDFNWELDDIIVNGVTDDASSTNGWTLGFTSNVEAESQGTAFALMALESYAPSTYLSNVVKGIGFLYDMQHSSGQFLSAPSGSPDEAGATEVTGECLAALLTTAPSEVFVDDDWAGNSYGYELGTGKYFGYNAFDNIQDGIDAVFGSTVHVADGTYVEQVEIAKDLTLVGAGTGTIIQSPNTLALCYTTSDPNCPIVYVHDANDVTIQDLVVDGAGKGNANYRFQGIGYRNAGGTVDTVEVKDVRDTPFSGSQHGVALYVYNDDNVARSINVWDSVFTGFQKNAMALNASDTTPLTVDVTGNTVTGYGTTAVTAQNGIQVFANMGTGTVADNTVSGIGYDNTASTTKWVATSILNYYADIDITGNTVTGAQVGVYYIEGSGDILNNTISVDQIGNGGMWGVIATDPPDAVPSPFGVEDMLAATGDATQAPDSTLIVDVSGNTVTFVGGDNTSTFGIEADAGYGVDDLAVTANDNVVTGFEVGIEIWQCQSGCAAGVFTSVVANDNCLASNDFGMRSNVTYLTVDGRYNWWGADTGPYNAATNPGGAGADVSDGIDFIPWVIGGCGSSTLVETELSASTGDALFCTGETTDVFIDLADVSDLYGYQFEVSYDQTKASAAGAFVYSFFDTNGSGTVPPALPDPAWDADCTTTPGTCKFARVELNPDPPVSGSGTLAQITLTGVAPGTFEMEISNSVLSTIDGAAIGHLLGDELPITVCGLANISGFITLQGRFSGNVDPGTVELTEQDLPANFSPISPTTFDASLGAYTFTNVPFMPGGSNYEIRAKHGLYLDNAKNVLVTGPLTGQSTRLWGGDANNTGNISIADLSCIGGSFGGPVAGSCTGGSSDINADGVINIQDLSIAAGNYQKISPQPW